MIRLENIYLDAQAVIVAFFKKLISASTPWTSWNCVKGWPTKIVLNEFKNGLIYVMPPMKIGDKKQIGGRSYYEANMIIGIVNTEESGGEQEGLRMSSSITNILSNPQAIDDVKFNITLAAAITNTTLRAQGVKIGVVVGPIEIQETDFFRHELTVILKLFGG